MIAAIRDTLMETSVYLPLQAKIRDIYQMNESTKLFYIDLPHGMALNHRPGQFLQVSIMGVGEAPITYELAAGARYDVTDTVVVLGSYRINWIDFDKADGTPDFDGFELSFGWKF